ncbi:MAG: DUF3365 domain-containing protein [Schleiferiaceae bacterium]|nr:DUF3365 domain-containing protein [Schleiferiaceae bacterium]
MQNYRNFLVVLVISGAVASCGQQAENADSTKEATAFSLDTAAIKENGKTIVQASFQALSGELKAAMQRGGVAEGINYCNVNAYPLTDSLSQHFNATVKRTSHRVRNAANTPDNIEKGVINGYLKAEENGNPLSPTVVFDGEKTRYFHPIELAGACLTCHGQPNIDIQPETLALINQRYPLDKATGFDEGAFRGVWSITFNQ